MVKKKRDTFQSLWKFLSSVKLAITLLIIIVIVSIIGTLIPQQLPLAEYVHRYGKMFGIIKILKLNNLYHSLWFIILLAFFSLNMIVCTLNRLIPTWKGVFKPRIILKKEQRKNLNLKTEFTWKGNFSQKLSSISKILNSYHYRVREKKEGKTIYYFASKGILGRFGTDIVHLSILIILIGAIIGGIKGYREHISIPVGSTIKLSHEDFLLRVDDFKTDYYPTGQVKDWKSTLTIVEDGQERLTKTIEVNHPLTYKGVRFYQSSYGWDWEKTLLTINIKEKGNQRVINQAKVRVGDKFTISERDLDIYALAFVPDFVIGEGGQIFSRSNQPNNPALFLEGRQRGEIKFREWIFAKFPDAHFSTESEYKFELIDFHAPEYTGLQITRDPGVVFVWLGCGLIMLGLTASFYIFYRRIWLAIEIEGNSASIWIGGATRKGKSQFNKEFKKIVEKLKRSEKNE
ncbi:MAG: cytochrome c biogenesis protein ResB [Candidatus Aminicenantia bacterium]